MKDYYDFTPVEESLSTAHSLVIALPANLNLDKVASALALYLSLKKTNRQVSLVCSRPMTVEYSCLVGVDKIKDKLSGKNLVVSFDYVEDSIEKVSYNIENNKFNLVIQPKEGYPPLSTEKIQYSYFGEQADLILIVGANSFEDLGEIYFDHKKFFQEGKTVNINISQTAKPFGTINLLDSQMASLGEFITLFLLSLKMPFDEDIASNLLLGIERATDNFSLIKSTPVTFEAVAFCLRSGARKPLREFSETSFNKNQTEAKKEEKIEIKRKKEEKIAPSPDWFKPKIYKGNTKI
jgi:nanoRNase/pAp phosphatase (c-di-AMP/oligoRNAs hydrolase)